MKSKYNSVVKVKKQALDKAENQLNAARMREKENEMALQKAILECNSLLLPSKGSVKELRENLQMQSVARSVKERANEKFVLSQKEVLHYQHLYKRASLDYEKMKYLESEDLKEIHKKLTKLEQKALDEVAVSRFFYGAKDEA